MFSHKTVSTIPLCVEVNGQIKEILGHFAWRILHCFHLEEFKNDEALSSK